MPATLTIHETPKAIHFGVQRGVRFGIVVWLLIFAVGAGYLLVRYGDLTTRLLLGAVIAFTTVRGVIQHLRGTDVTLEVNNLDLISTGHAPDGYGSSSIPRASGCPSRIP